MKRDSFTDKKGHKNMIYAFLANGFEEIEAITIIDILRRAEKEVITVGIGDNIIRGAHGMVVVADTQDNMIELDDNLEMIFLPGGMPGTLNLERSAVVQSAIDYCVENDKYIAAICAAPSILGHKGILDGKKACCYPGFEQELKGADVNYDAVNADGKIVTSRGAGTAIKLALKLVELFTSPERSKLMGDSLVCL